MRWLLVAAAAGSALASKLTPPVLPLIVRNPYLSTWLGDARQPPWHEWPMFWTGERVCTQSFVDKLAGLDVGRQLTATDIMADKIDILDWLLGHGLSPGL